VQARTVNPKNFFAELKDLRRRRGRIAPTQFCRNMLNLVALVAKNGSKIDLLGCREFFASSSVRSGFKLSSPSGA
jgi:hypothetical protein